MYLNLISQSWGQTPNQITGPLRRIDPEMQASQENALPTELDLVTTYKRAFCDCRIVVQSIT